MAACLYAMSGFLSALTFRLAQKASKHHPKVRKFVEISLCGNRGFFFSVFGRF